MRRIIFLFIGITACLLSGAQQSIYCRYINRGNGLMEGNVLSIVQDSSRFIWIGGDEGIQRFDGKNFSNYYTTSSLNIPRGRITRLYIDRQNRLWIGSFFSGFGFLDLFTRRSFTYHAKNSRLLPDATTGFREFCQQGDFLYAAGSFGLVQLKKDSVIQVFNEANSSLKGNLTGHVVQDRKGQIWIGSLGGLSTLRNGKIINYTNNHHYAAFAGAALNDGKGGMAAIAQLYVDHRNRIWISNWLPGLYMFDQAGNKLQKIKLPESSPNPFDQLVTAFTEDNQHNLWIGTSNNGLYRYNPADSSFTHFTAAPNSGGIASNQVYSLFKDADGFIWVGGKNVISVFDPGQKQVQPFFRVEQGGIIAATAAGNDRFWAIDRESIYQFDSSLRLLGQFAYAAYLQKQKGILPVWSLHYSARSNSLLIGCEKGFAVYDISSKKLIDYTNVKGFVSNPVTDAIDLGNQRYVLCHWWWSHNLQLLDGNTRSLQVIDMPPGLNTSPFFEIANAIPFGRDYLLPSKKGLLLLDTTLMQVRMYNAAFATGRAVFANNELVAVTAYDGIRTLNLTNNRLLAVSKQEGLNVYNTSSVLYTGNNHYWISASPGLYYWNRSSHLFRRYAEAEGLPTDGLSGEVLLKTGSKVVVSNGDLYAVQADGTTASGTVLPGIISCIIGDRTLTPQEYASPVAVNYERNNLQVRFGAINQHTGVIRYQYQLEGFDKEWTQSHDGFVNYTGLPAGRYRLLARAQTDNLFTSPPQLLLTVDVEGPFYKAWWFICLNIMLLACAAWLFYQNRIRSIMQVQQLRNNISRDLHDEVGSTLSSLSILSASALQQFEIAPHKSKQWLQQIGDNARNMLNVMDEIVWTINPKMDSMGVIISRLKEYAYNAGEAAGIEVLFQEENIPAEAAVSMLIKRNFYLVVKEAINNALKHSGSKQIQIILARHKGSVMVTVADNGSGFDAELPGNGNGIANMRSRAAQVKADLRIVSVPGKGTSVTLVLPM